MTAELDDFLDKLFGTQDISAQESEKLKTFYPEGCFFHWDGTGMEPTGSVIAMRENPTIEDVCRGCSADPCAVRKTPYHG